MKKLKALTAMALAFSMVGTSVVPYSTVFAAGSDSGIEIQSETSLLETADGSGIEIVEENPGITVTETTEAKDVFDVSFAKKKLDIEVTPYAGDTIKFSGEVANRSEHEALFRLYFWEYGDKLPDDNVTDVLRDVNTRVKPDLSVSEDEDDAYVLPVKINGENKELCGHMRTSKDESGKVTARYFEVKVSAETEFSFDFGLVSDSGSKLTVLPVLEDCETKESAMFDAVQVAWDVEDILITEVLDGQESIVVEDVESETEDEIVIESEEQTDEESEDMIIESQDETEADTDSGKKENAPSGSISSESEPEESVAESESNTEDDGFLLETETDVDDETEDENPALNFEENLPASEMEFSFYHNEEYNKTLDAEAFASQRLVVISSDEDVIVNPSDVIGQYGDLYLMQFSSVDNTMDAYAYYKGKVDAVEPDMNIEAASEDAVDITEDVNPMALLSDVDDVENVSNMGVIALIDTGVKESENVIDRVSVIDDKLEGNGHGDDMLKAIVSQNEDAQVLSIRAMNDHGLGSVSSLAAAIQYAMDAQVDMINLSLYAKSTLSTSVVGNLIQEAIDSGIMVVGAAGNDGADVKDYIPGSIADAYILGAADEDGKRIATSNYGTTVDYNVIADSTSEAAALFTGYVSKNGTTGIEDVLNQDWIYETDYVEDDIVVEEPDDPFEDMTRDERQVVIKYLFVDSDAIAPGMTITDLYDAIILDERLDFSVIHGAVDVYTNVYADEDGSYKFRADGPMKNGLLAGESYAAYDFTHANVHGEVVTNGVSFDMNTGIATVDDAFLQKSDGDYAYGQIQVMVPVTKLSDVPVNVTIESMDGDVTSKTIDLLPYGTADLSLPFETPLTSNDFDVEVDGNVLSDVSWDDTEKVLSLSVCAAGVSDIHIKLNTDADDLFQIARRTEPSTTPLFYLPDGTDVTKLINAYNNGTIVQYTSAFGLGINQDEWGTGFIPQTVIGYATGTVDGFDGSAVYMGYLGLPRDLFDMRDRTNRYFIATSDGKTEFPTWHGKSKYIGENDFPDMNSGIAFGCVHAATGAFDDRAQKINVNYKIYNMWTAPDNAGKTVTYFAIEVYGVERANDWSDGSRYGQTLGGSFVFAVKPPDETKIDFKIVKEWSGDDAFQNARPDHVHIRLEQNKHDSSGGLVEDWHQVGEYDVFKKDGWTLTIPDLILKDVYENVYDYRITEDAVEHYVTKPIEIKGKIINGKELRTATVTNERKEFFVDLAFSKNWNDNNNEAGIRPGGLVVHCWQEIKNASGVVIQDWKDIGTHTLTAAEGWSYTWTGMPLIDMDGNTYDYKLTEDIPEGYEGSYTHFVDSGHTDWSYVRTASFSNKVNMGFLRVFKKSSDSGLIDGSNYTLKGATFEVYTNEACTQKASYTGGPLVVQDNNYTPQIKIKAGTYWIKETKAPAGHSLVTKPVKVEVKPTHISSKPLTVTVTDQALYGELKLVKKSKYPEITDDNKCYSLQGAVYGVYTNASCSGTPKYKMTTGSNGQASLTKIPFGKYWVKEIEPSQGFKLDTEVYDVVISQKSSKITVTSQEPPKNDPVVIRIDKTWKSENTGVVPPLDGTQFTIQYYDNTQKNTSGSPKRKWVIEVQKLNDTTWWCQLSDEFLVKNLSSPLYEVNGDVVLPLGTYEIWESQTAPMYEFSGDFTDFNGNRLNNTNEHYVTVLKDAGESVSLQGGHEYKGYNEPMDSSLTILKYGDVGKTEPLANVEYELKNSSGKVVATGKTDGKGKAYFKGLYPDTYTLTELKTAEGHMLLKDPVTIVLPTKLTPEQIKQYGVDTSKVIYDKYNNVYYVKDMTLEITNTPNVTLPMTGGVDSIWTFAPLVCGMTIFAGLGVLFVRRKKKI